MADNLIFPIQFDLQKAVERAGQDWDKTYAKKLETYLAKRPIKVKINFENLTDVKTRLAQLKIEPITPETKSAIKELASELRTLAKALEGYLSRYLHAALTMMEKPKRKNDPATIATDSTNEQSSLKIDNMPPKRHIAPIMPMALGTMLSGFCCFFFSSNSSYRSNPDLGFSSMTKRFWCKITNSHSAVQVDLTI